MAESWWKHGVIYHIYPRSFLDTNGDGVGDLGGIVAPARLSGLARGRRRLDFSVLPSPMADFGYDIMDYCGIDPLFGSMQDFDAPSRRGASAGDQGHLDFVPNHTSDQHPWFLESRSSRSSPKRDWYIWRDGGADGVPPNNWMSNFGGRPGRGMKPRDSITTTPF